MFRWLGKLTLSQSGAPMLLQTLRRVESRGVRELPHAVLEACGQGSDIASRPVDANAIPLPIFGAR